MHWGFDWVWGISLIVVTVIGHSLALFAAHHRLVAAAASYYSDDAFSLRFALAMGGVVLFVTLLLGVEASLWASVFVFIGALPNMASGMLYSLEAMTTFGHADVSLTPQWQLLGALEALGGVIVVGLSTAFIFSILHGAQVRQKEIH